MTTELALLSRVAFRGQEITRPRLRGLLALLAADLRSGCGTGRLVEGLWPDELPDHPAKALQVLVSQARAQLGSEVIVRTPVGYRLSLAEDQVDASAVLLRAAASAQHSRSGDQAAALDQAEAGLALWDGPESWDSHPADPVSELRSQRASTHRALVRARALALARLGRHAEAADPLAALVAEHPRDEEVLAELLRCEAATVGASAALARYDAYRRSLRDELGTDPGPELRAVHQGLLRGGTQAVRHRVPHEPNELLGREDDIEAVTALLRTSRVTSVVGAGGLGKTRLAHAVARRAEQRVVHVRSRASPRRPTSSPRSRPSWGSGRPRSAGRAGGSTSSPASSTRSAPVPRCWCSTTASTSSTPQRTSCGHWCPPAGTCACSPPAAPRWACPRSRSTRCRS